MTCKAIEDMMIECENRGEIKGEIRGEVRGSVSTAMKLGKSKEEAIEYVCKQYGVDKETVESYIAKSTD